MKTYFSFLVLTISSVAFANKQCIDVRAAFFEPCIEGEQLFFVQGICTKSYEAESRYCASMDKPDCIDARATLFAPCEEGKTRVYVQGRCSKSYKIEHTYCAIR